VVGGVGEIKKTSDASPNVANGLSKGLSMIAGGAINSSKGLYVAELNQDALKASLLAAGKAFNDEIVKGLGTPQYATATAHRLQAPPPPRRGFFMNK
jgi:hypothetical protein